MRARNEGILINLDWSNIQNIPADIGSNQVTFEVLNANGDVGAGPAQVAAGDHDHEIGNVSLVFENALI